MEFQVESVLQIKHEILPLLQEHMEEICFFDNCCLMPDFEMYHALFNNNMFFIATARDKGCLVGYSAYIIAPNMHYKGVITATNDVLFLKKEYRNGLTGAKLVRYSEQYIKDNYSQVTHITHKYKNYFDLGKFFERMGYQEMEKTVIKEV